ncbi:hypothetical protein ACFPK9_11250 [Rubritalea spongiae]|uniref:Cthe-2314-like HEPN domain-containing protein n=2 Tax=Rubritalea spongiae TaxID=430797 RepID=A0ABW5E474_9BACT
METIYYEHVPGGYGQIRYNPLLLANVTNTQLEEWFLNYKYLHFLLNKDTEEEFAQYKLPVEFEYSMRTRSRSFQELADHSKILIDQSLFQDLFRVMVSTLEKANEMIEITNLKKVGCSIEDFKVEIKKKVKAFHKKPFPEKVKKFEVEEGFKEYLEALKAVNKARNCFEHRNGVLGKEDCNSGDKLVMNCRYPAPVGRDNKPIEILDRMPLGEHYRCEFVETKLKYRISEKLKMGFVDSYKLIYTINFALKGIVDDIYRKCSFDEQIWIIKQFKCEQDAGHNKTGHNKTDKLPRRN